MIQHADLDEPYENASGTTRGPRRVDLDIRAGELVTIMGPSGAGKSTLLATMGMLDVEPTDPASLVIAAAGLSCVALLACLAPALRALAIQPVRAPRYE